MTSVLLLAVAGSCSQSIHHQPAATASAGQTATVIESFQGPYRFLSNFWPAEVVFEGVTFPTAEHAYQAAKSLDLKQRHRIALMPTPSEAKRAGRGLPLRPDWDAIKLRVMEDCVRDKFTRHPDLRRKLLDTDDAELIEKNTWGDRFWGVCDGQGENHLGRILMRVRADLREPPLGLKQAPNQGHI
jgi:ribA/ribD-fused uncharacterized protein